MAAKKRKAVKKSKDVEVVVQRAVADPKYAVKLSALAADANSKGKNSAAHKKLMAEFGVTPTALGKLAPSQRKAAGIKTLLTITTLTSLGCTMTTTTTTTTWVTDANEQIAIKKQKTVAKRKPK